MKSTHLLKSVAAAALFVGVSLSASANTTKALGTVSAATPTVFSGYAAPGGFVDTFTFTLPANSGSGYSVIDFAPNGMPDGWFKTVFSGIALFSNADGIVGNADDKKLASAIGLGDEVSLSFGSSAAGSYYLSVFGVTTGLYGGGYSGGISVTPVPEPETFAMLLAGLGVMGAIARRRKI